MKTNIGLAILVIAVIGGGWYLATYEAPQLVESQPMDVYSNDEMGFSIRIPKGYTVDESHEYQLNSATKIHGVKFSIPAVLAEGTNLGSDTYISVESMPQATACTSDPFLEGPHLAQTQTENGVTYAVSSAENAGAGNRYVEIVYALPNTSPCIAVRYLVHYSVIENYPEGAVREYDLDGLLAEFDIIRVTLEVDQQKPGSVVGEIIQPVSPPVVTTAPMTIATNLNIPWELVFLPGGDMLVTERSGRLVRIGGDRKVIEIDGVAHNGEGGLLGLALDPRHSENGFIYLYLTTSSGGGLTNRVERYKLDGVTLSGRQVIIEGIPGASNHDGGRIAFGPDGMLYITTGDAGREDEAQSTESAAGKILRVRSDGSIPTDNPFGNAIYSYGHRNVQGIAWDNKGQLWATEHGRSSPSGFDELNKIVQGGNYGWPEIQGYETEVGMIAPQLNSGASDTWAPSGMAYLGGHLIFAGLKGESLYVADISIGTAKNLTKYLEGIYGRLRTVTAGPDNMLYILTNNRDGRGSPVSSDDRIIKIDPKTLGM